MPQYLRHQVQCPGTYPVTEVLAIVTTVYRFGQFSSIRLRRVDVPNINVNRTMANSYSKREQILIHINKTTTTTTTITMAMT